MPKERPPDPHAAGTPWRLFIAIPLPEPAQALIASVIDELDQNELPVRWTAAGSAHLTLHFLDDVDPSRAELLRLSFGTIAARQPAFELTTSTLGCFPDEGAPRVVWLGLAGATRELTSFQRAMGMTLRQFALEPEERSFRPHITLGRVRDDIDAAASAELRARLSSEALASRLTGEAVPIPVERVQLMRSFLERGGARHELVATALLKPTV